MSLWALSICILFYFNNKVWNYNFRWSIVDKWLSRVVALVVQYQPFRIHYQAVWPIYVFLLWEPAHKLSHSPRFQRLTHQQSVCCVFETLLKKVTLLSHKGPCYHLEAISSPPQLCWLCLFARRHCHRPRPRQGCHQFQRWRWRFLWRGFHGWHPKPTGNLHRYVEHPFE